MCCRPWGHRVGHDRATELKFQAYSKVIQLCIYKYLFFFSNSFPI